MLDGRVARQGGNFLTSVVDVTFWSNAKHLQFVHQSVEQSFPRITCRAAVQYAGPAARGHCPLSGDDHWSDCQPTHPTEGSIVSPTNREIDSSFRKQIFTATDRLGRMPSAPLCHRDVVSIRDIHWTVYRLYGLSSSFFKVIDQQTKNDLLLLWHSVLVQNVYLLLLLGLVLILTILSSLPVTFILLVMTNLIIILNMIGLLPPFLSKLIKKCSCYRFFIVKFCRFYQLFVTSF